MQLMLVSNWSLMDVSLASPDPAILPDWQDLSRRALVPSGYNAPELLLPALMRHERAKLATVRDSEGLQLALPLVACRSPLSFKASLSTPISFYGLPHLGPYSAVPALTALLRHLNEPVLLHSVPMDGVLWDVIRVSSARLTVINSWERAVVRPQGSYAGWYEANFDRKRRKEQRRLHSRLAEKGKLEAQNFAAGDDTAGWVDDFLDLEAKGWKGKRGTALKADPSAVAALHEAMRGLAGSGKLRFWKLALDGRPIAMMFGVADSGQAWLGKIAYDEDFARFSPGVQLILQATETLFAEGITLADSCAIPDHPMINHLWRGRLRVADVMIAGPGVSRAMFNLTVEAERLRRRLRSSARGLYYRITGRKPS